MGVSGAASAAELTQALLGSATQQTTDLVKKMVTVNVAAAVRAASEAGIGEVLDAVA